MGFFAPNFYRSLILLKPYCTCKGESLERRQKAFYSGHFIGYGDEYLPSKVIASSAESCV